MKGDWASSDPAGTSHETPAQGCGAGEGKTSAKLFGELIYATRVPLQRPRG